MQLAIEMTSRWGRPVLAEVSVQGEMVEVRVGDQVVGVADRRFLRHWLRSPGGVYAVDAVAWIPAPVGGGVALAIDDVAPAMWLADHTIEQLREAV